ncbi:unnamed protein product [Euphydryas editha]|uniref:Uncharacterized protein n=1 Tax=Euphydryas editha TaxID=104508 RepID=A0AAU9V5U8_EUPED|nr:unnamed protein product [Euphydryas editha]
MMMMKTRVRCEAALGDEFQVEVGVYQGFTLRLLLFNLVMVYITSNVQQPISRNILVISNDGNIDADIEHRRNIDRRKWRELTGVLCDTRISIRTEGKVYKPAVRPDDILWCGMLAP